MKDRFEIRGHDIYDLSLGTAYTLRAVCDALNRNERVLARVIEVVEQREEA